jgi:hypothetical protein
VKHEVLLWGLAATAVVGCGLSFGDLPEPVDTGATPTSSPTGSATPSPTGSPTTTTPPTPDGSVPLDGSVPGDGGALDAAVDAAPPKPSTASVTLRFDRNGPLFVIPSTETYTDGVFQGKAIYRGPSIDVLDAPRSNLLNATLAPATNLASVSFGTAGSTKAVDIDNAQALMNTGTVYDKFTVTAWVKRATTSGADTRDDTRILSFGETAGTAAPFFEIGMFKQSDEKLIVSIGGAIGGAGDKMSGQKILDLPDKWTFIAVTYNATAGSGKDLCFYVGDASTPVAESSCEGYGGKSFTRGTANAKLTVGNASNDTIRNGATKVSFPGKIDEVSLFLGQTLPLAALEKIQKE